MDKGIWTFTKKWVSIIITIALIDIQVCYVLAFLGRDQIAEELSKTIVVEIIGVFLGYCVKSFFEKKESQKNKSEDITNE